MAQKIYESIKVKQIFGNKNEVTEKGLEDFLNEIGEERIINIVATPGMVMARAAITAPTMYTVIYRS